MSHDHDIDPAAPDVLHVLIGYSSCGHPFVAATRGDDTQPEPAEVIVALQDAAEAIERAVVRGFRRGMDEELGESTIEPDHTGRWWRLADPRAWWTAADRIRRGVL